MAEKAAHPKEKCRVAPYVDRVFRAICSAPRALVPASRFVVAASRWWERGVPQAGQCPLSGGTAVSRGRETGTKADGIIIFLFILARGAHFCFLGNILHTACLSSPPQGGAGGGLPISFSPISITCYHFLSLANAVAINLLSQKVIEVIPFSAKYTSARVRARERIFLQCSSAKDRTECRCRNHDNLIEEHAT